MIFRDQEDEKHCVTLSNKLTCTCNSGGERCVHSLFALIKVFKIEWTSHLIFQQTYSEANIDEILASRFKKKGSTSKTPGQEKSKKFDYLRKKREQKNQKKKKNKEKREIDPEDPCSVCYENLETETLNLYSCKTCKNHFHVDCMIKWTKHQMAPGSSSSGNKNNKPRCPMCRAGLETSHPLFLQKLESLQLQFKKKEYFHKGKRCLGCGKPDIIGKIYLCLWCP